MQTMQVVALILLVQATLPSDASAASVVLGDKATPVEKVITLLEDLSKEITSDAKKEAATYNKFACFAKDMTAKKSDSIKNGQDNVKTLSATIQAKTADKESSITEKATRTAKKEALAKDLTSTKAKFAAEQATYQQTSAELSKAIIQLEKAIKSVEKSRPTTLLLQSQLRESLELAQALDLVDDTQSSQISTFLQVDPKNPAYKFHSEGIIDVLKKLLTDYRAHKSGVDNEWKKTETTYKGMIKQLNTQIADQKKAISALKQKIERLKGEIATARQKLVQAQTNLQEDLLYLKDLTKTAEDRAEDWDQRSQCRADELAAQTAALKILKGTVSTTDKAANKRALLVDLNSEVTPGEEPSETDEDAPSFLQRTQVRSLLQRARGSLSVTDVAKSEALQLLASEARRLQSPMLLALAAQATADPFTKIKKLIQQLIERLLKEANAEATKKGFCDTELGKAESARDYRKEDVLKLNNEIQVLEVKHAELKEEATLLGGQMTELSKSLTKSTKLREADKAANLKTIKTAKDGLAALNEAILILKNYYSQAAKASSFLQQSPVEVDMASKGTAPGFEGKCTGKQEQSTSIVGLLEVIRSDYERTIRNTEAAEKKAAADFVEFDRSTKADYSGKNMTKTLDLQDAETTKNTIGKKMKDLQTNQALLDAALKELEELKPTCIDTGMTYAERVAKREEEMAALKKALCILDTDKVEPLCQ